MIRFSAPLLAVLAGAAVAQAPRETQAEAVTHIVWLTGTGSPPAGPLRYLMDRLPDIRHETLDVNAKRGWHMLTRGEPACRNATVRTPEREKFAYFADITLQPPPLLLVRAELAAQLPRDAAGDVDLPGLLADSRWRGGAVQGRSYGERLDGLLAKLPKSGAFSWYAPRGYGQNLLTMLDNKRFDYLIEFDGALRLFLAEVGEAELVELRIGSETEPLRIGIACPRTPWGLAVMRLIDRALGTPEGAKALRESTTAWMSPESRLRYGNRIDAFFRLRAREGVLPF